MRLLAALGVSIILLLGCSSNGNDQGRLIGRWTGNIGDNDVHVVISGDRNPTGVFTFPADSRIVTAPLYLRDGYVRTAVDVQGIGTLNISGLIGDNLIAGSARADEGDVPFFLHRLHEIDDAARESLVGWYVNENDDSLLFTYEPYGGLYYFDFAAMSAGSRYPIDDSTLARFNDSSGRADVLLRIRQRDGATVLYNETHQSSWTRLAEQPYEQHEVSFVSDNAGLSGVLYCPSDSLSHPGLVYIHGSGGNNTRTDFHDMYMLNHLATRGIAVLIPDKRGCGRSEGDWRTAGFDQLARDALAATGPLLGCPTVDPERVGLFGFSQGGWIAPLAASMSDSIAFVVNGSGSAVPVRDQISHEMHNTFVRSGMSDTLVARFDRLQQLAEAYVADSSRWTAYAALRDSLIQSEAGGMAAGFPGTTSHWRWSWMRDVGDFDPMQYYQNLDVPVLVLYGADDEQDNVPVSASVRRLQSLPNVTIRTYEGSGHGLGDPSGERYVRTDALDEIVDFIKHRTGNSN